MFCINAISFAKFKPKVSTYYLAFCWTLFLTVGIWAGELSGCSLFRSSMNNSLLSQILFRLIILSSSLIFVQLEFQWGFLILAGFRGMCYGFLVGSAYAELGNAGWVYCLLFYFENSISVITDLWFWSVAINAKGRNIAHYLIIVFVLDIAAILIDWFFFSSFLSELICL